jgi:hypothetical protein
MSEEIGECRKYTRKAATKQHRFPEPHQQCCPSTHSLMVNDTSTIIVYRWIPRHKRYFIGENMRWRVDRGPSLGGIRRMPPEFPNAFLTSSIIELMGIITKDQ